MLKWNGDQYQGITNIDGGIANQETRPIQNTGYFTISNQNIERMVITVTDRQLTGFCRSVIDQPLDNLLKPGKFGSPLLEGFKAVFGK